MLKLSTHIPLEYIKQSKKLQGIVCDDVWHKPFDVNDYYTGEPLEIEQHWFLKYLGMEKSKVYPAPTIADIIDNAEMLFGDDEVYCDCCVDNKIIVSIGCTDNEILFSCKDEIVKHKILGMCQQNKSIQEISEYILTNIK